MIRIRPATSADLAAIERITAASPTAPQWTAAQFRESIAPCTSQAVRRAVFVAEDPLQSTEQTGAIGFAVVSALISVYPIEAELESIAVDPVYRGRGGGAALLQAAGDWLLTLPSADVPAALLRLEVRVSNLQAIHLYRRQGFAQVAIRPGYYAAPPEDAICMEREIIRATS